MARQLRLFVACELPEPLLGALAEMQDQLREQSNVRLRWVRPEGIHLTLKFLGEVDESRVDGIATALLNAIEPFEIKVRPSELGGFGRGRLRVIWVGLQGDLEALGRLASLVDVSLAGVGFDPEERPFRPHLTLARVPDRAGNEERRTLSEVVSAFELPDLPEVRLCHVSLMSSVLGPGGARYEALATFPA